MNTKVIECVSAIMSQCELDEKFRPDITKNVAAVFAAGKAESTTITKSEPLSADEIALIRDSLRPQV